MIINNSNNADISEIFRLYRLASAFQKTKDSALWPEFSMSLVLKEIEENRQWKLIIDNKIACVWAVTFNDPEIWGEKDADKAMYIHRIATNPEFRGHKFVEHIVRWSKTYAKEKGLDYIRLDTVGENKGLIAHYTNCGFQYLGLFKLEDTSSLPAHYQNSSVSLFEIKL
ncbi:GNAT family N-acetyltransferase [Flavobacteriaceae bacterium KMM 6898]|nr:GNAT family N-acetyltransferase [Flavobacteriaceae bacterium KMM 6898]